MPTPGPQKKAAPKTDKGLSPEKTTEAYAVALENMPEPPPRPAKSEHLFIAWTGAVIRTTPAGADAPDPERDTVRVDDLRVFGRKDLCTEFAVDQEPAWKWVQTAKGESVRDAILAKAGR